MKNASSLAAFRWLSARYARPHWPAIAFLTLSTLAGNLLTVMQPAILAGLLASLSGSTTMVVPPGASLLNLNYLGARIANAGTIRFGPDGALVMFGLLFLLSAVLIAVMSYLAEYCAAWLRVKITSLIQLDLLNHLFGQDMAFFSRRKSGELMSRVASDSVGTAQALGPLLRGTLQPAVQLAVYSLYLFSTSVWLTVGALFLIVFQFGVTQLLRRPTRRFARLETDMAAELLSGLQEAFTSIRVTKSFGAEAFELDKLTNTIHRVDRTLLRRSQIEKIENPVRSILDAVAVLGIFLIAIVQMRQGQLTFQGLILFTFVGRQMIAPMNAIATLALWIETLGASFERISELRAEQPTIADGPVAKKSFDRALELRNVSFAYGSRPAVDDVSLEIKRGEFVALVGPSGAGKSTLADLILRLYDPQHGQILVDGTDLRAIRQREYRRLFGVVSQESLLFHDTVRSNIRFGRVDLSDADVERAAHIANAHEFIMGLPEGYDTIVGDRGIKLSGGERQRVAIARAVVHAPSILILDEATSSLDSESERLVQEAIDHVAASATAIVIAHRLSTVMHADRIVVLNGGRIEAVGRHQQLLDSSSTYRRFCQLQFERPTETINLS